MRHAMFAVVFAVMLAVALAVTTNADCVAKCGARSFMEPRLRFAASETPTAINAGPAPTLDPRFNDTPTPWTTPRPTRTHAP